MGASRVTAPLHLPYHRLAEVAHASAFKDGGGGTLRLRRGLPDLCPPVHTPDWAVSATGRGRDRHPGGAGCSSWAQRHLRAFHGQRGDASRPAGAGPRADERGRAGPGPAAAGLPSPVGFHWALLRLADTPPRPGTAR